MRSSIDNRIQRLLSADYIEGCTAIMEETRRQLEEYFQRKREVFDLPLFLAGSDFQRQVWEALKKIPYGSTVSYRELAAALGRESALRAVASANGANALSIIVPCHRVIGSNGDLTGYAGGLRTKSRLLELEKGSLEQGELFTG